jgi:uncharacterized protein
MTTIGPGVYFGTVTHKRLRPVPHELAYDVASLLVSLNDLKAGRLPSLLGYNRWRPLSIFDRDHGAAGDQTINEFAWSLVANKGLSDQVSDVFMLCYPRVLGYGFNPLTVYFCVDQIGSIRLMIYEVHNTFGGRHTYVSDAMAADDGSYHRTEKVFRVSPFNGVEGEYGLRATRPVETVSVGVALSTDEGPLLKAYFAGRRKPLNNWQLLRILFGLPLMSLKVIVAIHWEALKLLKKGLKVQRP